MASVNPVSYHGPCAGTVGFTGSISTLPNTPVTYQFFYKDPGNSQQSNLPGQSGTTNAQGVLAVSNSGTVSASGQGYVQFVVTAPSYAASNKATLSVTCTSTSTPSPMPSPSPSIIPVHLGPSAPTNLTNTTDSHVCGQHIFPLVCVAMSSGVLTLVWNWNPSQSYQTLDGYSVYRVDHGMFTRVARTTAGQAATGTLLQPISGGFNGTCYVARAYKGSTESASSNTFCVGGTGVIAPVTLTLTQWGARYRDHTWQGIIYPGEGLAGYGLLCNDVCMGWMHWETGSRPFGASENTYWRGYMLFDPNQISQLHNITNATLSVHVVSGNPSCFGGMGPATAQWVGNQDFVDGDFGYNVGPAVNNSGATFNVTGIVKDWASGALPNFGFVFKGNQENNDAYENNQCLIDFATNPVLTIHHY